MIIFYYVKFTVTNILFVEIQIGKRWHVLSIRKSIRIPRAIVEHLHPGLLRCKITVYFISLCNVLKPDKLECAFKGKILEIVLTFEWNWFEPLGIYIHRVNKENVNRYYLGTEYSKTMPTVFSMDCQNVPSRCCSYYKIVLPNLCGSRLIALKKLLNI